MKTPKEKAKELVNSFLQAKRYSNSTNAMSFELAKECAKIAVNEIIEAFNSDDIYIQGENNISYEIEYWQEVLKEIDNL